MKYDFFILFFLSLLNISSVIYFFSKKPKKPLETEQIGNWNSGFIAGIKYAMSSFKELPKKLRGQTPVSLHDVEIHINKLTEEINKNIPYR